ncbi:MAG: hypothetical protein K5873_10830 [Treponema sp.]|nr:hypothetical protein [Treponema sp.]
MRKRLFFIDFNFSACRFFFCIFCLFCPLSPGKIRAQAFFNFADYKFSTEVTLPEDDSKKAVSGNTGLRLSFRDGDFRTYFTLPKSEFSAFEEKESLGEKFQLLDKPRWGGGIFLFRDSLPLTIKAGHNTYSKSLSKMKNPSPSVTANPLTKSFAFTTGLGPSLTGLTSSSQPLSLALSLEDTKGLLPVKFSLEGFFNEEKEGAVSLGAKYVFSKSAFFQTAFTLGSFYIENQSSVLKKNNADFSGSYFISALGEGAFFSPLLKMAVYSGFQQSPYEKDSFWFRLNGRSTFKNLLLDFTYFAIPTSKYAPKAAPLIGASSSVTRIVEQASINPQILFLFNDKRNSSLRAGLTLLENWKVTSTNTPVQLNTMKIRAALSYENSFFNLKFDWAHSNILLEGQPSVKSAWPEENHTFTLAASLSGEIARYYLDASYGNYPPMTESSFLKERISFNGKISFPRQNISGHLGSEIIFKEGKRYGGEIKGGINFAIKKKYLRSSFRISLAFPF